MSNMIMTPAEIKTTLSNIVNTDQVRLNKLNIKALQGLVPELSNNFTIVKNVIDLPDSVIGSFAYVITEQKLYYKKTSWITFNRVVPVEANLPIPSSLILNLETYQVDQVGYVYYGEYMIEPIKLESNGTEVIPQNIDSSYEGLYIKFNYFQVV